MILRRCDPGLNDPGSLALRTHWDTLASLVAPLGAPAWIVNLVPVDDARMEALNGDFRRKPGVTDVLSFSYLLDTGPDAPDLPAKTAGARGDLWVEPGPPDATVEEAVGELILAPAFVSARCAENGWDLREELGLLVVHGCLHILGWDHETDSERTAMQAVELDILGGAAMGHPLLKRS